MRAQHRAGCAASVGPYECPPTALVIQFNSVLSVYLAKTILRAAPVNERSAAPPAWRHHAIAPRQSRGWHEYECGSLNKHYCTTAVPRAIRSRNFNRMAAHEWLFRGLCKCSFQFTRSIISNTLLPPALSRNVLPLAWGAFNRKTTAIKARVPKQLLCPTGR